MCLRAGTKALQSFLIEIGPHLPHRRDPDGWQGLPAGRQVMDSSGMKGTGRVDGTGRHRSAVPVPVIASSGRCPRHLQRQSRRVRRQPDPARSGPHKMDSAGQKLQLSTTCAGAVLRQGVQLRPGHAPVGGLAQRGWNLPFGGSPASGAAAASSARSSWAASRPLIMMPTLPNLTPASSKRSARVMLPGDASALRAAAGCCSSPPEASALSYYDMIRRDRLPANSSSSRSATRLAPTPTSAPTSSLWLLPTRSGRSNAPGGQSRKVRTGRPRRACAIRADPVTRSSAANSASTGRDAGFSSGLRSQLSTASSVRDPVIYWTDADPSSRLCLSRQAPDVVDVPRDLVREAVAPIALLDRDVRYVATSQRWMELLALGRADPPASARTDLAPPIPERWRDAHRRGLAGEHTREREDWL